MKKSALKRLPALMLMVSGVALSLSACSSDTDERLSRELSPPPRFDVLTPPVAPDPSTMHPALQIAKSRGLKTNVYFNEELQQSIARLQGIEETLGRLQADLQGTSMAMQRVEMMRQEIEALNLRFQSLQERLLYAGPTIPAADPMPTPAPEPVQLIDNTSNAQLSTPVLDERPAAPTAKAPLTGNGVVDVRMGVHADKVRLVLDIVGGNTTPNVNLDAAEKLLTVELPGTPWDAATSKTMPGNPVVLSYTAQASGNGTLAAFMLKGDTSVLETKTYKGVGGKPTKVVIDLAR